MTARFIYILDRQKTHLSPGVFHQANALYVKLECPWRQRSDIFFGIFPYPGPFGPYLFALFFLASR